MALRPSHSALVATQSCQDERQQQQLNKRSKCLNSCTGHQRPAFPTSDSVRQTRGGVVGTPPSTTDQVSACGVWACRLPRAPRGTKCHQINVAPRKTIDTAVALARAPRLPGSPVTRTNRHTIKRLHGLRQTRETASQQLVVQQAIGQCPCQQEHPQGCC